MAHFAKIDKNNIVESVLVVDNSLEHSGEDYLSNALGLIGTWIQTSYNNKFRKQYAGIGFTYDAVTDIFIAPQPYASWSLDQNYDWQPPIPMPLEGFWIWNEEAQEWQQWNNL